jgi:hypothetical protein
MTEMVEIEAGTVLAPRGPHRLGADGKPLAFLDYGDEPTISYVTPEARAAALAADRAARRAPAAAYSKRTARAHRAKAAKSG